MLLPFPAQLSTFEVYVGITRMVSGTRLAVELERIRLVTCVAVNYVVCARGPAVSDTRSTSGSTMSGPGAAAVPFNPIAQGPGPGG